MGLGQSAIDQVGREKVLTDGLMHCWWLGSVDNNKNTEYCQSFKTDTSIDIPCMV